MSIHTKTMFTLAVASNFAVCVLAYLSVDQNVLPLAAVMMVPYAVFGWAAAGISCGLDLIGSREG